MEVIPAVDIRGGKCVQLYQGDYSRETVFSDDPVDAALRWVEMGATRLHVVDLDGARAGSPQNLGLVGSIVCSVSIPVQLGGGIRTAESARESVALGVERVFLGTSAVDDPRLVEELCRELGPEAVSVSVDARDGYVAVRGWTGSSRLSVPEMVARIEGMGVRRFMYTDIARDGTLTEPNFRAIEDVAGRTHLKMLAAGGISSLAHLLKLSRLGVDGAIVGTAAYTGDINMRQAIQALSAGA